MKIVITLPFIRQTTSFKIYSFLSTITFRFRDQSRLFLFNGVLFAEAIPKELILLCIDYDVAFT